MSAQTLTEVAVEVHADMKKVKPEVVAGAKAAGEAGGEVLGDGITRGVDGKLKESRGKFVAEGARAGAGFSKGFGGEINSSSGTFAKVAATMAARFALVGGAAAAAAPGLLHFTAALVPATGAALALPAALISIKAASATTRLAVLGVGDAITAGFGDNAKKAEEALKNLSGNARNFAKQIIALKPQVDGLKNSVQDRFFKPLLDDVQPLAQLYLPMLRDRMSNLAGPLGGLAEQLSETAQRGFIFNTVGKVFDQTRLTVINLRNAVDPLVWALATLVNDIVGDLPGLAGGFAKAAERFADFITYASETGKITQAFRNGIATLKDFGGILVNIGSIVGSVYRAATAEGNTLLANLRQLTGQAAAFFKTADGAGALASVFGTLGAFGEALRTSLGAALPAIAQSLQALGPAVAGLAGPASQLVVAIAPLLPLVAGIAATIIKELTPAIAAVAGFLAQNEGAVKGLVAALLVYNGVMKLSAFITGVSAAGGLLKYVASTRVATVATTAFATVQKALSIVMATSLGPIGLIITGIAALVAGLVYAYKHHEGFRNLVQTVWGAIKKAVSAVVDWFTGTALPWMQRVWKGISDGAKSMWEQGIRPAVQAIVAFWQNVLAPTAMWLWNNIIKPAFNGISAVVKAAMAVAELALAVMVAYVRNVLAPAYMWLWNNIVKPVFNGIVGAIRGAWSIIKVIFDAIVSYVRNVLAPVYRWLWNNVVKPVFAGIGTVIRNTWNNVIKPIFTALVGFLKDRVVKSFQTSVEAIRTAWDKVREYARKPIAFVVNSVINPLIGGFNKVAKVFGTSQIEKIGGFARGGRIPGRDSRGQDNLLATVFNDGKARGMIRVGTGEFITNTESTNANEQILQVINGKRGKVTHDDLDPYLDGYARGGRVGRRKGDGIGDFFDKVKRGLSGIGDFITNPEKALSNIANSALNKIPGSGMMVDVLKGMGRKVIESMVKWVKGNAGGALGGGSIAGGYRAMQSIISAWFPGLRMISGFRRGSRTLSGNQSYHALGRAVDYPPLRALAARIKATYGAKTKELITPYQDLNLHNGRPHRYTGAVWNQHNFAGGNAHVHWAARLGGLLSGRSRLMPMANIARADFGSVTLQRGWNMVENRLGRPEKLTENRGDVLTRLHPADIDALATIIGREIARAVGAGNYAAGRTAGLYARSG